MDKRRAWVLNDDRGLIELAAVISMLIDHIGAVFFPMALQLRVLGRIAMPLFCYKVVMGVHFTKNPIRYAARLLVLALISQYPYVLALRHPWLEGNVLFTLGFGALALLGVKSRRWLYRVGLPFLAMLAASLLKTDYGYKGVLLILLLHFVRFSKSGTAATMVAFCLFWGQSSMDVSRVLFPRAAWLADTEIQKAFPFVFACLRLQALAVLALPLMVCRTSSRVRISKWLSYAVYPAHLLMIYFIKG